MGLFLHRDARSFFEVDGIEESGTEALRLIESGRWGDLVIG